MVQRPSFQHDGGASAVTHKRIILAGVLFVAAFTVIAGRMIQLMGFEGEQDVRRNFAAPAPSAMAARADIVDRHGRQLATDLSVFTLYADAANVWDAGETVRALLGIFPELDGPALEARIASGRGRILIKRDLSPRQQAEVHALGMPGLSFDTEMRRVYPNGSAAAHVLGYVGTDHHGLAGIELSQDAVLGASAEPLALAIDLRVQHVLDDELAKSMAEFQAIGAAGIVMDVHSGEVVAMSSLPVFDPNNIGASPPEARFNSATLGVFEMGSTFKAFNTAMALDSGLIKIDDRFDARHPIPFGRFQIRDFHPQARWLTVSEIFEHSSNIGSARMAMVLGVDHQRLFLSSLGLLEPTRLEIPENGRPLAPANWSELSMMTISYGHGMSVSPLHTAAAISAMVNGGFYVDPTILRREQGSVLPRRRVISDETSAEMRRLMRLVVEQGTGSKADVEGYPVGGKTGTAEKPSNGGYARKALISSFVGVFPADAPEYLVFVMLDEPQPTPETFGYATAGWTAAPTTAHIVARIGPLLGIAPRRAPRDDDEHADAQGTGVAAMGEER